MNPKRLQFVWETGGMYKKGFVPLISETLDWRQRMIPKYKLLMKFQIADGSDDSNLNSLALAMTLNVYVQVTDSHLKEVGLRHLK